MEKEKNKNNLLKILAERRMPDIELIRMIEEVVDNPADHKEFILYIQAGKFMPVAITPNKMNLIKNSKVKWGELKFHTICKIAYVLGVSVDYLTGFDVILKGNKVRAK